MQYTRALAALMVVYFHMVPQIPAYARFLGASHPAYIDSLANGVPIFFVISGFIMYLTGIDSPPLHFARRRLFRIVPLYWLLTAALYALSVWEPHLLRNTDASRLYFLKSLLFVPYVSPNHATAVHPEPLLAPGWSLNYEMAFYVLFACALLLPARLRLWGLCTTLLGAWVVGLVARLDDSRVAGFYFSPLLLLFAAGLVLGWLYRRDALRLNGWLCAWLIAIGLSGVIVMGRLGAPWVIPLAIAVVLGVCSLDLQGMVPRWRLAETLGDASYSLYLTHFFTLGVLRELWPTKHLHGPVAAAAFAAVTLVATSAVAIGSYRLIERPAVAVLSAWFGRGARA